MIADYAFLCDIDGTLLRRDVPLSDEVIDAAHAFVNAGGYLALCTGRSTVAAREIARRLRVNLPCILYGGASLYDFSTESHIVLHSFQNDIRQSVALVLERYPDISMQVFTRDDIYVLRRNARLNARGVREENVGEERPLTAVSGDVVKLVMCCDNTEELCACEEFFPAEYCDFAFASRNFVDVVPRGCNKADTMMALASYAGIPPEHFFAAGDGATDLPLLQAAGISFAPNNAVPQVKDAVQHVVGDVKDGGMARAFRMAAEMIYQHKEC